MQKDPVTEALEIAQEHVLMCWNDHAFETFRLNFDFYKAKAFETPVLFAAACSRGFRGQDCVNDSHFLLQKLSEPVLRLSQRYKDWGT
jgi:hypothetical protein